MQWSDRAIVLSSRKLGENSAVVRVLTPEHGLYAGVDRGAFGKRKRGIYQTGNIVSAHWQARLTDQLGMLDCELLHPVAATVIGEARKLAVLSSAAALVEKILVERERQAAIYVAFETLIEALWHDGDYLAEYVRLEFALLACSGFGVDLGQCAATGQTHDLAYVSPKSGRAVSRDAGKPYHDRMLILPGFMGNGGTLADKVHIRDIINGIKLCGYFLGERVFSQRNVTMPAARVLLVNMLHNSQLTAPA
ncbi:MAG TPA: DNA repair protein RecO [Rickettsiales bacterium]|nr:DNA repair protein RecO [Rickettsiales bacterium]